MSRTGPLTSFAIRVLRLPQPAEQETYDNGLGTVLPAANFRRWVVWIPPAVFGSILGLGLSVLGILDFVAQIDNLPLILYAGLFLVWLALVVFVTTMSRLSYLMFEYTFDDLGLHIRKGAISIQEITLSYRNIQNVSIMRGPFDLLLGLSKVTVDTAGGGDGGAAAAAAQGGAGKFAAIAAHRGTMLGIDRFVAEDLRRDLEARMRQFHGAGLGEFAESRTRRTTKATAAGPVAVSPAQLDLLRRIVENLRAANAVLAPSSEPPRPSAPSRGSRRSPCK